MYELDFRNIIVFISLGIHTVLLWLLFRYGRKTRGGKEYTVAILAIAGWVLPMVLYRSHFYGEIELWARLLYIMASFTSVSFLFFTLTYPIKTTVKKFWLWIYGIEHIALIATLLLSSFIIKGIQVQTIGEDIIVWGPLYVWFALHISIPFLIGFYLLYKKSKKVQEKRKKQARTILYGYFFGANLAMVTNLLLPWFGYFELNWLGQFFSTLVAIFTTYAILKYQLLNIRVIATELFIILLNFILFLQVIISTSRLELITNGLLFFAVVIISILLLRSVKKEVHQRNVLSNLTENLKKANKQLTQLDELKTEFLSIATHQLRTPLSIIKGYISLLDEGAYGRVTKKQKKIYHNIDISNERLVKLVDEFLNISRIEQGRTKYRFESMKLSDVLSSVVEELKEKSGPKNITLSTHISFEKEIIGDADKLRHAIFNYVDNAIKYSDRKTTVDMYLEPYTGGAQIRVVDAGPGLDKKDLDNLFQKFYRSPHVSNDVDGTGLGIYVVKEFVGGHGGAVWAKSAGIGKGSEFGFFVPLKAKEKK